MTITNTATNQSRETVTNEAGGYTFATVPAGTYEITVVRQGFQTASRRDVTGNSMQITGTANTGRDGIDERVFRLGLRLSF